MVLTIDLDSPPPPSQFIQNLLTPANLILKHHGNALLFVSKTTPFRYKLQKRSLNSWESFFLPANTFVSKSHLTQSICGVKLMSSSFVHTNLLFMSTKHVIVRCDYSIQPVQSRQESPRFRYFPTML